MGARPFLKWVGGKRQLLPELLARVPEKIAAYHEPFLGGGALFFELRNCQRNGWDRPRPAYLSDTNDMLVQTYRAVRDCPERVIKFLKEYEKLHSEEFYYKIRAMLPSEPAGTAAWFIYINRAGFNGLWRVNKGGYCNVPWGKHPAVTFDVDNLRACSRALEGVKIRWAGFQEVLGDVVPDSFVYCDPPYVPLTATASFTGYTAGGFSDQDQQRLVETATQIKVQGGHVLLSNSGAPRVRELYPTPPWRVEEVSARRAVNSKGNGRGPVRELLIS